jgi:hypothetical protein
MTWTRATYLAIWGVLSVYYVAFRTVTAGAEHAARAVRIGEPVRPTPAAAVTRLSLDAHGTRLRCELRDGQWAVVEPADSRVPADLIAAIVATLTELPPVDVVPATAGTRAAEFGLEEHSVRLTVGTGSEEVRLQLGARNPSQTAVYARRDDEEEIVLVGLNVQYYVDLLIEASRRPPA